MKIERDFDLTNLNTFGVKARAKFFVVLEKMSDFQELMLQREFKDNPKMILGGGSNILFTKDWDGIVIQNQMKGIEILSENEEEVLVRAASGEVWHDLVLFAINRGLWGIENLSFIPGTVGAAPMQNIGAYGAELKNTLISVEAYDLVQGEKKIFSKEECDLGYRDSIFKNAAKNKYFISAINLRLSKKRAPNTQYRVLQEYIEENNIDDLSLKNISNAVVSIRKNKLPDPKVMGNAGSFFKNVFVDEEVLRELQQISPGIPYFREPVSIEDLRRGVEIKIPAGWLIEACGWKGKRVGNVGMHSKQALVLVNYGGATGSEIKDFAQSVIDSVRVKFGITLIPEVNFV